MPKSITPAIVAALMLRLEHIPATAQRVESLLRQLRVNNAAQLGTRFQNTGDAVETFAAIYDAVYVKNFTFEQALEIHDPE